MKFSWHHHSKSALRQKQGWNKRRNSQNKREQSGPVPEILSGGVGEMI